MKSAMRMRCRLVALVALVFAARVLQAESSAPCISPVPQHATFDTRQRIDVGATRVIVRCNDAAATAWVTKHLNTWLAGFSAPVVTREQLNTAIPHGDEAYRIEVSPSSVVLIANTLQGARYALYSYRQMWEPRRGTLKLTGYTAPCGTIEDWPAQKFRGIHFCWFDAREGTTLKFIEHEIRMAAYNKLNYAVVESWGAIRSERHPYLSWENASSVSLADVRRLAALARDLGVTIIPQFNVFGHASMARVVSKKHATLDCRPEYQPLFEPIGGWNWCLSNPEVRRIHLDLIDELLEAWGQPKYFHIGCDEADPPSCSACCAVDYRQLVADHLKAISDYLAARGVRPMMWHDMLLRRGDSRFKGFYCNGAADAEKLLGSLSRQIVICDWYYGGAWDSKENHSAYPTLDYFKTNGFDVVTCPWDNAKSIAAQADWVRDHEMFGTLLTTWNHLMANEYATIWASGPSAAWGASDRGNRLPNYQHAATLWRQTGWDMGLGPDDYREFGFTANQFDRQMPAKY